MPVLRAKDFDTLMRYAEKADVVRDVPVGCGDVCRKNRTPRNAYLSTCPSISQHSYSDRNWQFEGLISVALADSV
jgi:hypothetical protein